MVSQVRSSETFYERLGLKPDASDEDIRAAYVRLMRPYRQLLREDDSAAVQQAREISRAFDTLRDPLRRRKYDESLRTDSPSSPKVTPERKARTTSPFLLARGAEVGGKAAPEPVRAEPDVLPERADGAAADARTVPETIATGTPHEDLVEESVSTPAWDDGGIPKAAYVIGALGLLAIAGVGISSLREQPHSGAVSSTMTNAETPTSRSGVHPPSQVAANASTQSPALSRQQMAEAEARKAQPNATESDAPPIALNVGPFPAGTGDPAKSAAPKDVNGAQPSAPSEVAQAPDQPAATAPAPQVAAAPPPPPAPKPRVDRGAAPMLVSGGLSNSDNPGGAYQGRVNVRFGIGTDGRVSNCRVTSGSGNPALDARTCSLVQQRLRFRPALDSDGQPTSSEINASYVWSRRPRR